MTRSICSRLHFIKDRRDRITHSRSFLKINKSERAKIERSKERIYKIKKGNLSTISWNLCLLLKSSLQTTMLWYISWWYCTFWKNIFPSLFLKIFMLISREWKFFWEGNKNKEKKRKFIQKNYILNGYSSFVPWITYWNMP